MDTRSRWIRRSLALALICGTAPGALCAGMTDEEDPLVWAFEFASAIRSDDRDRAKTQDEVLNEFVRLGSLDAALSRAERVEGWRRGAVWAVLARALARQGRTDGAHAAVSRAEEIRGEVSGWQSPRLQSLIARARAACGDADASIGLATELAAKDPRDYSGSAAAIRAEAHAARGEFDRAIEGLDRLAGGRDLYVTWWRTAGYVAIAEQSRLPKGQRVEALDLARGAARAIDGWKRAEALLVIADEYRELGQKKSARDVLRSAQELAVALPPNMLAKAPLLAALARGLAAVDEAERARTLLVEAEKDTASAIEIDRPGLLAEVASGYGRLGDDENAARLYDRALESAESLVNARPRALAVVAVCRAMARGEHQLDAGARDRLGALLRGLGDPW